MLKILFCLKRMKCSIVFLNLSLATATVRRDLCLFKNHKCTNGGETSHKMDSANFPRPHHIVICVLLITEYPKN